MPLPSMAARSARDLDRRYPHMRRWHFYSHSAQPSRYLQSQQSEYDLRFGEPPSRDQHFHDELRILHQ